MQSNLNNESIKNEVYPKFKPKYELIIKPKYELINDETCPDGLFRIKALRNIPEIGVKVGDLGGYVANKNNLSQYGLCWIFNSAQVFDKAVVSENAIVRDNAWISGNARVYGDAQVCDSAQVFDYAYVSDNALIFGDAQVCGKAYMYE